MVNRMLTIGRTEGSSPKQRLEAIVNAANELKIPKSTFNKFFKMKNICLMKWQNFLAELKIRNKLLWTLLLKWQTQLILLKLTEK